MASHDVFYILKEPIEEKKTLNLFTIQDAQPAHRSKETLTKSPLCHLSSNAESEEGEKERNKD